MVVSGRFVKDHVVFFHLNTCNRCQLAGVLNGMVMKVATTNEYVRRDCGSFSTWMTSTSKFITLRKRMICFMMKEIMLFEKSGAFLFVAYTSVCFIVDDFRTADTNARNTVEN